MTKIKLVKFLLARIAEDEERAQRAVCQCGGPVCTPHLGWYRRGELDERFNDAAGRHGTVDYLLANGPARALAEAQAKRRIVESHHHRYSPHLLCSELLDLAAVYGDHPDYRKKWAIR